MKSKKTRPANISSNDTVSIIARNPQPTGLLSKISIVVVSALVAMSLFLNGDVNYHAGDHQIVNILWLFAAAIMIFFSRNRKEKPFYWQWFDTLVLAFFFWIFASFCVTQILKQGSLRPSLTLLTQWGGFAGMYFVFRTFLTTKKNILGILLVCLGLVFAETAVSFYQYFYEMPLNRAEYFANPEPFLQANQITTDMEREAFENRIKGTEPIGTYSLTNSLAGGLVPWLIVIFGLFVSGLSRKNGTQSIVWLALLFVPLAVCLFLTRSRSGWLAALFGLVAVALIPVINRAYKQLSLKRSLIFGIVILAFLFFGGLAALSKGGLVDGAIRSFGFRLQYWQSSLQMMGDYPLFGCGVGNYRQCYTQYKLPDASEIIADPHNFLMEIGTNAGVPALLFFLAILVAGICRKSPSSDVQQSETENVGPNWKNYVPYLLGGLMGMFLAFVESKLGVAEILFPHLLVGLIGFVIGASLIVSFFVKNKTDIPLSIVKIAMLALLVNLLAAGGISYPHVSLSLWFFLVICLNQTVVTSTSLSQVQKLIPVIASFVFVIFGFLGYDYAFLPNIQAQLKYREFQFMAPSRPIDINIRTLEDILRSDPHFSQGWLELFHYYIIERQYSRTPEVWTSKVDETLEKTIASSPNSSPIRESLGDIFLNDYLQTGRKKSLEQATALFEDLIKLYPNGAVGYAKLAQAQVLIGNSHESITAARKAIELDDIMPHKDKKLPVQLRSVVEKVVKP